jgi:phosphatidylserine decarboxylase
MKLHREGFSILLISLFISIAIGITNYLLFSVECLWLFISIEALNLVILVLIVQFFRIPKRHKHYESDQIVCPADGEVVVIEETLETEYFNDKRIQISIFMSPLNVHANYYPVNGTVCYQKYHPGKFLVAWHPKSSTENERTSMVIKTADGSEILVRQIAGAMARRICYYNEIGSVAKQGEEFGFIKFGSRIDVFLPLNTTLSIEIGEKVQGKLSILGKLNN